MGAAEALAGGTRTARHRQIHPTLDLPAQGVPRYIQLLVTQYLAAKIVNLTF